MGMTIGANWNGARAFTATSGPGVSLMSEFIGLAYFAEVPTVLFNVQRGGPSTGMPTRTQQSDILCSAYASHGDTKHVLLIPSDPKECFDFAVEAFDLADRLQTPVIVLLDLDLGMNDWSTKEFEWDDSIEYDRGKVLSKEDLDGIERFGRYLDVDGDGIPYRTYPGTHPEKGAYFTRGTSHDEYAGYTEDGVKNAEMLSRLLKKFQTASSLVPAPVFNQEKNESSMGIIYFGSTDCSMQEALDVLEDQNLKIDAMRIRAFPFNLEVWEFIEDHDLLFIVEQNRDGQMRTLIMAEGGIIPDKLVSILCFDGQPITAEHIINKINAHLSGKPVLAAS
jgi:2-oxoglutarate ferredoxin oxidoreductase subunit alpha